MRNEDFGGKDGQFFLIKGSVGKKKEKLTLDTQRIYSHEAKLPHIQKLSCGFSHSGELKKFIKGGDFIKNKSIDYQMAFISDSMGLVMDHGHLLNLQKKHMLAENHIIKFQKTRSEKLCQSMYTLDIEVKYIKFPKIHRRVEVPGHINLFDFFDRVFCPVMGYCRDSHSFMYDTFPFGPFENDGYVYGSSFSQHTDMMFAFDFRKEMIACERLCLCDFLKESGDEVEVTYDLGQRIVHRIKCLNIKESKKLYVDVISGTGTSFVADGIDDKGLEWDEAMEILKRRKPSLQYHRIINELNGRPNYVDLNRKFPHEDPEMFDLKICKQILQFNLSQKPSQMDCGLHEEDTSGIIDESFHQVVESSIYQFQNRFLEELKKSRYICSVENCGKREKKTRLCSSCLIRRYCSVECQRKDWGEHSKYCRQLIPFSFNEKNKRAIRKREIGVLFSRTYSSEMVVFLIKNLYKEK